MKLATIPAAALCACSTTENLPAAHCPLPTAFCLLFFRLLVPAKVLDYALAVGF